MNHLSESGYINSNNTLNSPQPEAKTDQAKVEMLLDVVQQLSLAKDLETIMYVVRKAARKLTGADGATFVLRDEDKCYYADEDAIAPLWKGKRFPMSICISGWVMLHRQEVAIQDICADPRIPADAYRPTFVKSLVMVPIRSSDPIGAIGTYWADHHQTNEHEISLLKALADSTSVALENIQLQSQLAAGDQKSSAQIEITRKLMIGNQQLENTLSELKNVNQQMKLLTELSATLQTCLYIEEAYRLVAQYATKLFPDTAGIFYTMHPSRNYLESMTVWGKPHIEEKIIKPDECLALRRGTTYKIMDLQHDLACSHFHEKKLDTLYTCIPLFAQSDILGMLYIEWQNSARNHNEDVLADMFSEQIALGISNIKLRETLRNLSFRDALTGLYNRRYLEETLERELSRCASKAAPLALFMIDIDHFKQFNDKYGHDAGDVVIQALARILRDFARKEDIACRYGGEEFIFVLPETDGETAFDRAKALHHEVSKIHLRYGGNALMQITISIGLAVFPRDAANMQALITAADAALYQAKHAGRNTTIIYQPS